MPPAGSHTSTPPPPHPQQQHQLRRSLRTVPSDMFSPVSPGPSSPPPPVPRRPSSASPVHHDAQQHYSPPSSTTSSLVNDDDGPHRASLSVQPLAVSRPRPDSTILPGSDGGDPFLLDPRHFTAVVRRGDTVQYWLPVELVIRGQPGRRCVPEGHWERLVDLAEDVSVCTNAGEQSGGNVQLVTAWCHARELARNGEHVNYETTRE
ncbi:unnamed protein product [Clonostachys chloroleuca]|uniref:Uncharacterized protein n=1 Tax=Clonostachys chloroleuca TaxID=1926264 RepID=A0AA35QDZ0_9HYPO|nr:unnamed protein product [Clonostachys chloroleuca]